MKLTFWIITGLASAFIMFSAIPDITVSEDAIQIFKHLGYPSYLLVLLGVLKFAGSIVILLPLNLKLTEWAYAGLVFDLVGAFYSHTAVGDPIQTSGFALFGLLIVLSSYILHLKMEKKDQTSNR